MTNLKVFLVTLLGAISLSAWAEDPEQDLSQLGKTIIQLVEMDRHSYNIDELELKDIERDDVKITALVYTTTEYRKVDNCNKSWEEESCELNICEADIKVTLTPFHRARVTHEDIRHCEFSKYVRP